LTNRAFTPEIKQVIFFDMNRTLLDPQQSFKQSFLEVLEVYTGRWGFNHAYTPEQIFQNYMNRWRQQKKLTSNQRKLPEQIRRDCLAYVLEPLPFSMKDQFVHTFWQQIRQRQKHLPQLYPHVQKTLEELAAKGYRLAVISNGSKLKQESQLKILNLQSLIPNKHLFSSQNGGVRKPSPTLFRQACKSMGVAASQAVMVGDSWKNDIAGAVNAGMDAIWLHKSKLKSPNTDMHTIANRKIINIQQFQQLLALF